MCRSGFSTSTSGSTFRSPAARSPLPRTSNIALLGPVAVQLEAHLLQIQDDLGHVFDHARQGRELVQHAVDPHGGDGRALQRGEQHAPQRVSQRHAEAALQGLDHELAVPVVVAGLGFTTCFGIVRFFHFISMSSSGSRATSLLRVELDDQLFVDRHRDVTRATGCGARRPRGSSASSSSQSGTPWPFRASSDALDHDQVAALLAHGDLVARRAPRTRECPPCGRSPRSDGGAPAGARRCARARIRGGRRRCPAAARASAAAASPVTPFAIAALAK